MGATSAPKGDAHSCPPFTPTPAPLLVPPRSEPVTPMPPTAEQLPPSPDAASLRSATGRTAAGHSMSARGKCPVVLGDAIIEGWLRRENSTSSQALQAERLERVGGRTYFASFGPVSASLLGNELVVALLRSVSQRDPSRCGVLGVKRELCMTHSRIR